MALDRELSLRRAEKLLRQGRLDGAIEEYERLVEDQPNDWNTRNALGDLYVRAGQVEKAAQQFTHIADHFAQEGFFSRAIALFKKVVKIRPDDEYALLQSAEVAARQGLLVDAKACLSAIAEQRRRRGDRNGANEILQRIAELDPGDVGARVNAARAAVENGDGAAAAVRYRELSDELFARGRDREGLDALAEAVGLAPNDDDSRERLVRAYVRAGEIDRARSEATTAAHFGVIADALEADGRDDAACDALAEGVERQTSAAELRARFVRRLIARNELERAAAALPAERVAEDGDLQLALAEVLLRLGHFERAREVLQALATRGAGESQNLVLLGCSLADVNADAAFHCIDVATDAAVSLSDWPAAAAALQEFIRRVPGHIPALIRLVDVCVDGSLDASLYAAQCDLADCYLAAGHAAEARVIAEDLTLRSPGDAASRARFRRALEMLGETDPDAVINDRLSAALSLEGDSLSVPVPAVKPPASRLEQAASRAPETVPEPRATPPVASPPAVVSGPESAADKAGSVEQPAQTSAARPAPRGPDVIEIDLSGALSELQTSNAKGNATSMHPAPATGSLDDVFREFRAEVVREQATTSAAQHYKLALTYFDMGMLDESVRSLEAAVRAPRYRFQAASLLGRIHRSRGNLVDAIEWFERAAETPAASADAARALLYELGRTLEEARESSRALAVYLELRADAGSYRDVSSRIEQLARPDAGD